MPPQGIGTVRGIEAEVLERRATQPEKKEHVVDVRRVAYLRIVELAVKKVRRAEHAA